MNGGATGRLTTAVAPLLREGQRIRTASDADGPALLALVGAAYDEFACGPLDPHGFDADLTAPATSAARAGRRWWVVTDGGTVIASVAHGPLHGSVVELHRLYLAPVARGVGLATALVAGIAEEARQLGARTLDAWSDTRLAAAHVRYQALGFVATGARRELHDPADTTELHFSLRL